MDVAARIEWGEVQRLLRQGAPVVEVLPDEEYRYAHLPGAVNIPLRHLDVETAGRLRGDQPVVVYCHDLL